MLEILLALIIILITVLYYIGRQKHKYWSSKGIKVPDEGFLPIIGHMFHLNFKSYRWEYLNNIYEKYENKSVFGMYQGFDPCIIVNDPELIRLILVKDADYFMDRRPFITSEKDHIFKEFLSIQKGEQWKALRNLSTPTFSSGKIKGMFPLVDEKVTSFLELCDSKMKADEFIDIKDLFLLFALDVIGTCAMGVEIEAMKEKNSEFQDKIKNSFDYSNFLKMASLYLFPPLRSFFGLETENLKFVGRKIEEVIKYRQDSGTRREDYIDILLDALKEYEHNKDNEEKHINYPMTWKTVVSSCVLFLFAGYDTTSNALAFIAYLLAANTDCQDELRKEIKEIIERDGELNYQNMTEAKYLDSCISESLRIYPPGHVLERLCTRSFQVPDSDLVIPNDMLVSIPVYSIHRDPKYFEDPLDFKPERFMPENKSSINQYAYLPWGHGIRNCIGMRFALMEIKIVIARLVMKYEMSLKPGYDLRIDGTNPMKVLQPDAKGVQLILEPYEESMIHESSGSDNNEGD